MFLFSTVPPLQEPDPQVRRRTVEFLELIEQDATPAIPALIPHLADPDRFVSVPAETAALRG